MAKNLVPLSWMLPKILERNRSIIGLVYGFKSFAVGIVLGNVFCPLVSVRICSLSQNRSVKFKTFFGPTLPEGTWNRYVFN